MGKYSEYTRKNTLRLKGYDYSSPGYYFITILTHKRELVFGQVEGGDIILSEIGVIAETALIDLPQHHPQVSVHSKIIMPNHLHLILELKSDSRSKGAASCTRKEEDVNSIESNLTFPQKSAYHSNIASTMGNVSVIIRNYKSSVSRKCRRAGFDHFSWHRGFYDTIIRNDKQRSAVREYIRNNPFYWINDPENPVNLGKK